MYCSSVSVAYGGVLLSRVHTCDLLPLVYSIIIYDSYLFNRA